MSNKPEPQTTVMFSKTDWDDLHVIVESYKTSMERMLDEHEPEQPDARDIIERRIQLAKRIMRMARR